MEKGIKTDDGSVLGKTIIFARNHNHAVLMQNVFDEMYPQYGGNFCRVIDNYDPRAGDLIDDFKGVGKNKKLAIGEWNDNRLARPVAYNSSNKHRNRLLRLGNLISGR